MRPSSGSASQVGALTRSRPDRTAENTKSGSSPFASDAFRMVSARSSPLWICRVIVARSASLSRLPYWARMAPASAFARLPGSSPASARGRGECR